MIFNRGDTVIIHKPKDTGETPFWLPDIDRYDGMSATVYKEKTELFGSTKPNTVLTANGLSPSAIAKICHVKAWRICCEVKMWR